MQTRLFIQLPGLALAVLLTLLVGSAAPQGTPNVITKFGDAGLPNANSTIFDNGTNVGIGTTNPATKLEDGIQVHGGVGFTRDHHMHLDFKRAKSSEVLLGNTTWHRERTATLIPL